MDEPGRDLGRQLAAGIATLTAAFLHAIVGVFYLSSGRLAPGWAVALLLAVWVALAALLWRWRRRGPVVLAIPFVAAAVWWLTVALAGTA